MSVYIEVPITDNCNTFKLLCDEYKIPYKRGCGYYKLGAKVENISKKKKIILLDKTNRFLVSDNNSRELINIEENKDIKINEDDIPSEYDCYINSTSANRKLIANTCLLDVTSLNIEDSWKNYVVRSKEAALAKKHSLDSNQDDNKTPTSANVNFEIGFLRVISYKQLNILPGKYEEAEEYADNDFDIGDDDWKKLFLMFDENMSDKQIEQWKVLISEFACNECMHGPTSGEGKLVLYDLECETNDSSPQRYQLLIQHSPNECVTNGTAVLFVHSNDKYANVEVDGKALYKIGLLYGFYSDSPTEWKITKDIMNDNIGNKFIENIKKSFEETNFKFGW